MLNVENVTHEWETHAGTYTHTDDMSLFEQMEGTSVHMCKHADKTHINMQKQEKRTQHAHTFRSL